MIPLAYITAWGVRRPWPTPEQVEQDLLLSRAMSEISMHPLLGEELVFRGGTALHKLHLKDALRYSEDLDYVRRTSGGIQPITGALLDLGRELGFSVSSRLSAQPKVYWKTESESGLPLRIKLEINTYERSPVMPPVRIRHEVDSGWWSGNASILTFQPEELVATKIRALFQRNKGRDLFDLWVALTVMRLDPGSIVAAFAPYKPDGYSARAAINNLESKVRRSDFRWDLRPLLLAVPEGYEVESAADLIVTQLLEQIM